MNFFLCAFISYHFVGLWGQENEGGADKDKFNDCQDISIYLNKVRDK